MAWYLCCKVLFISLLVVTFVGDSEQQQQQQQQQDQARPEDIVPQSDVAHLVNDLLQQPPDSGRSFSMSAAVIQAVQRFIKRNVTLLVPTNQALQTLDATQLSQRDIFSTMERHVVTFPVQFSTLQKNFGVGMELPTMLGDSLRITSNEPGKFAIGGVNISVPDLCKSTVFMTCHGIDGVLLANSSSRATAVSPVPMEAAPSPEAIPAPSSKGGALASPSSSKRSSASPLAGCSTLTLFALAALVFVFYM